MWRNTSGCFATSVFLCACQLLAQHHRLVREAVVEVETATAPQYVDFDPDSIERGDGTTSF
jgi:hypothetical protein